MLKLAAYVLAVAISAPAMGSEARTQIHVQVQVVHSTKVQLAVSKTAPVQAPRAVPGGTEYRVPLSASAGTAARPAGVRFQVTGCEGAQATWSGGKVGADGQALKVFVPTGAKCAPVVVATVYPDGAPTGTEEVKN